MKSPRVLAAAAVLLAALPTTGLVPAEARTKRILPTDFVSVREAYDTTISPVAVGCLTTAALFAAELRFPAGATLTGIRMYSSGVAAARDVTVWKTQAGLPSIAMAMAEESAPGGDPNTPLLTSGIVSGIHPNDVFEPGYLYNAVIACNPLTAVWAVEIDYAP